MLTQQEKEQMENVFKRNKKLGIAPQTKSQLAKKLGMSRQLLYYVIAKNVNSPYEPILKNWIKEANGKGCKIVYKVKENKLKLLEKYGFEHSFKSYYTKYTTMDTGSYQYVVNESDLILKLIVTNEDKVMLDLETFELPYDPEFPLLYMHTTPTESRNSILMNNISSTIHNSQNCDCPSWTSG